MGIYNQPFYWDMVDVSYGHLMDYTGCFFLQILVFSWLQKNGICRVEKRVVIFFICMSYKPLVTCYVLYVWFVVHSQPFYWGWSSWSSPTQVYLSRAGQWSHSDKGVDHLKLDQVKKNGERHCKKWKFSHQTQVASAKTNSLLLKMAIRIHLLRWFTY